TVGVHLLTSLIGDFIGGKHRWLNAARRLGILLFATLLGFGAYFVSDRSLAFLRTDHRAANIGVITSAIVLLLLGFAEWRRWFSNFRRAPDLRFDYRVLRLLTLITAMLGVGLYLYKPHN